MSEVEPPKKDGTLWLRPKRTIVYDTDSKEIMKESISIWYYGNNGWESIIDFDTKYVLDKEFDYTAKSDPIYLSHHSYPNEGKVSDSIRFRLYDGSRSIGNNGNLVTETGLKKHVDELNTTINELLSVINGMNTTIENLNTRLILLENN